MPADLHVHTTFSDGTDTPEQLVRLAKAAGLKTIALTDHDEAAGIPAALLKGQELGLEVIPGIEFTSEDYGTEIHILGYFIDYTSDKLLAMLQKLQRGRVERIYEICAKLEKIGIPLVPAKVLALAGNQAPGRPHVARAMVEAGYISDFRQAFRGYLEFNGPAYAAHYKMKALEAISLILACGGIPVYAHPGTSNCDQIIPDLVAAGLLGLEVYYPAHDESRTKHYLNLARKYALLVVGGSDYHGQNSGRKIPLGEFTIDDKLVKELANEYARRNRP